ncbi:MAG: hypothetical protein WBG65_04315, partial [Sulfurimonadaceae bacterium]
MIAYNTKIQANPPLGVKGVTGSAKKMVAVEQKSSAPLDRLSHRLQFINNQGREVTLLSDAALQKKRPGKLRGLSVENVVTFWWEEGASLICYAMESEGSLELVDYWLLHTLLPLYFTLEKQYDILHAGAVDVAGLALLFIADSCGGKSTMTDFFIQQGHRMLSDDKVATYEEAGLFFAVPSYPYHRPYRKAEDLGYFVSNFTPKPEPIGAIYELERVQPDAPIEIVELSGIEKFTALRYASEMNFSFLKPKRFDYLMRLAANVPLFRVHVPWDIERLSEVHNT